MGALTPTTSRKLNFGNQDGVVAAFTAIADTDTWDSGMSVIEQVIINNGASGVTYGSTVVGGTVTFAASGAMANVQVTVMGFN